MIFKKCNKKRISFKNKSTKNKSTKKRTNSFSSRKTTGGKEHAVLSEYADPDELPIDPATRRSSIDVDGNEPTEVRIHRTLARLIGLEGEITLNELYGQVARFQQDTETRREIASKMTDDNIHLNVNKWVLDKGDTKVKLLHISEWDVSAVTNMSLLFCPTIHSTLVGDYGDVSGSVLFAFNKFNEDLSKWKVKNVTNMMGMFSGGQEHITEFNNGNNDNTPKGIGGWDVSKVTNMQLMFSNNKIFNRRLFDWDIHPDVLAAYIFKDTPEMKEEDKPRKPTPPPTPPTPPTTITSTN
jgi:surface protein